MKEDEAQNNQNDSGSDPNPAVLRTVMQQGITDDSHSESGTTGPQKKKGIFSRIIQHPDDHTKVSLFFDLILVIVTATYATFAALQWKAMNRQASGIESQVARMAESIAQTQTLIDQQREALDYAKIQADVAKQALQDTRRSTIPVIQMGGWDFKPSTGINAGKITASVSLANRGSADATNGTGHIVMEIRKDEPPLSYQPNWKISNNVTIQRNHGERSFEVSRTFSQSEIEEIWAEHKFICVFGFLDYLDPFGDKVRKRFCVKYGSTPNGSTAGECETWQGQEDGPK